MPDPFDHHPDCPRPVAPSGVGYTCDCAMRRWLPNDDAGDGERRLTDAEVSDHLRDARRRLAMRVKGKPLPHVPMPVGLARWLVRTAERAHAFDRAHGPFDDSLTEALRDPDAFFADADAPQDHRNADGTGPDDPPDRGYVPEPDPDNGIPPPIELTPEEMHEAAEEGREASRTVDRATRRMEGLADPHVEAERWRRRAVAAERERSRARHVVAAARRAHTQLRELELAPVLRGERAQTTLRNALRDYDREANK